MVVNTSTGRELGRKHANIMLRHRRRQLAIAAESGGAAEAVVQQPRTKVVRILESGHFSWVLPEAWMFSASSMVADEVKMGGYESEMVYPAEAMQLVPYMGASTRPSYGTLVAAACDDEAAGCLESYDGACDDPWATNSSVNSTVSDSWIDVEWPPAQMLNYGGMDEPGNHQHSEDADGCLAADFIPLWYPSLYEQLDSLSDSEYVHICSDGIVSREAEHADTHPYEASGSYMNIEYMPLASTVVNDTSSWEVMDFSAAFQHRTICDVFASETSMGLNSLFHEKSEKVGNAKPGLPLIPSETCMELRSLFTSESVTDATVQDMPSLTNFSSTSSLLGNLFESDDANRDDDGDADGDADEMLPTMNRKKVSGTNDLANYLIPVDERTQPIPESMPALIQQVHSLFESYCAVIAEIERLLDEIAEMKTHL